MRSLLLLLLTMLTDISFSQSVVYENIFFIKENGKNYLNYYTIRTDYYSYNLYIGKDTEPEKDYQYIYPNYYEVDTESNENNNIIQFDQGSYAILTQGTLGSRLNIGDEGIFTFKNSSEPDSEGRFGHWNKPVNFEQFVYVWVLPKNFEFVDYKCNNEGDWVIRQNTLSYFGYDVNNLAFTIRYKPVSLSTYSAVKDDLKSVDEENISVENVSSGVNISIGDKLLFPSGSAVVSEEGKKLLATISKSIKESGTKKVIISGHTDNVPIKTSKFPSNWDLSAARALSVIYILSDNGVNEGILELRAFGPYKPVASNNTDKGRAKNRRIEILLSSDSSN